MSTTSREDYIKIIYNKAVETGAPVSTSFIAQQLSVTQAAISDMLKKLHGDGLVRYEKYKGVELTDAGIETALKVLRRHRLWELFLINVLGMSWDEVHDEAERLEHQTSDVLINKIDEYLRFPKFDPHGSPIPDRNGEMPEIEKEFPITECENNADYTVRRVNDDNNELIRYLSSIGLIINASFRLLEKYDFDNSVLVLLKGKKMNLSSTICRNVFVKKMEKN